MKGIWARFSEPILRWFRPTPAPGRWIEGRAFTWQGFIGFRPWTIPRREFRLYIPRGYSRWRRAPLVVLLHGCKQTGAELAQGTRITALADTRGLLVLMPEQPDAANPYRCWNWFDARTARGRGEAAIVAAMIRKVSRRWRADAARVVVAGMSAGAALAAIMGVRHPKLVRAVISHSGIACGAASSAFTALAVMRGGPETDVARIASSARTAFAGELTVPLLAIQGSVDDVVAPRHGAALARQYLALNGVPVPAGSASALPPADLDTRDATTMPHIVRTREWHRNGRPLVRLVEIEWLGHAWSGGDPALPFNDGAPPDATAMIGDWIGALSR